MAIAAVKSDTLHMMTMAELHRLLHIAELIRVKI